MSSTSMFLFQFPPACNAYLKEFSWQDFRTELMQSRQVFGRNRAMFDHCSKRDNRSIKNGIPNRLSCGVFPSDKRSWMFRTGHNLFMESAHHVSSRPDCNGTADVPSLTLRTALSAIPFVFDLCGVVVQWFQERFSQDLPISKGLSV